MRTSTAKDFGRNIASLQNKNSDATIEEEYIKGLQDEIKFLEYELKLLKDKELEQQANYSQLDKFFSDGVPINENILAMKNQYSNIQSEMEGKLRDLVDTQAQRKNMYATLKADIKKIEMKY